MRNSISVSASPAVWIVLALAVLVMPLPWLIALFISSAVHELCHYGAVRLCGGNVTGLRIGLDGLCMIITPMTAMRSMFCSLAGPLGALALLLTARIMPRTALCAAIQSLYHLLPIYPLDGGRALRSLLDYFGWNSCVYICIEFSVLFSIAVIGGYLTMCTALGAMPLCLSAAVIFRTFREKYLANRP